MATANAYRFAIAVVIYFAAAVVVVKNLAAIGRWPSELIVTLTYGFVLAFGALTFSALKGGVLIRMLLVVLLAPLSHFGFLVTFGSSINIGLVIQETISLLAGATLVALFQWAIHRGLGRRKNEA